MSNHQLSFNSRGSSGSQNLLLTQASVASFAIVMLILCWSAFVWLGVGSLLTPPKKTEPNPGPAPNQNPPDVPHEQDVKEDPTHAAAYSAAERKLLLNLQRTAMAPRLDSLQAALTKAKTLESTWRSRFELLMTSSDGRRLADAPSASKMQFLQSVVDAKTATADPIGEWLMSVQKLLSGARGPIDELDTLESRLLESESRLSETVATLEQANEVLNKMVSDTNDVQDRTLEAALAMLDQESTQHVVDQVALQIDSLEATQASEIKSAADRQTLMQSQLVAAEQRLDLAKAESAQKLAKSQTTLETDAKRLAEQKAELRRQMESELPGMRSLLSPFITPGYRQPRWESQLEITPDSAPMSFTALQRVRALEDSPTGMDLLLSIAQSEIDFQVCNDRPFGSFPRRQSAADNQRPEVLKTLRTVQEFLRKYGEVMVEAKLLAP